MKRKVGCNAKTIKQYKEHVDRRSDGKEAKIRIRIAKLATRAIVKWKRHRKKEDEEEEGGSILRNLTTPTQSGWEQKSATVGKVEI